MFGIGRRQGELGGVQFCDGRGEVSTAAQRSAARLDRERTRASSVRLPR